MRIHSTILRVAVIGSALLLNSCSRGFFGSPLYLAVTISPRPVSIAAGGTVVLAGVASNNLSVPTWSLLDAADAASVGSLTAVTGSPNSILFTAPLAPPIYNSSTPPGFTQGTVTVEATLAPPAGSTLPVAHDSVTMFITAAAVTVGLAPATAVVPLSGTQAFTGYAVGSVNNALTWQVNGVTGGTTLTGMITAAGVYTAPSMLPMTGNTVVIMTISQADPSQTASAVVTLAP
jgi:hypothetical protein